jgi:membrane protein required for colicin V production
LFRGFIKELFALIGIIGGVFIASRLASQVGEIVDSIIPIDNNNTLMLAGFIISLILFWILAYFVGIILSKVIGLSGLGIFDKFLGFVFGAGKVFLLFSIIVYAVSQVKTINDKLEEKTKNSIMFPLLKSTGNYIIKLDTKKLESTVSNSIDKVVDTTKKTINNISTEIIKEKINELKGTNSGK